MFSLSQYVLIMLAANLYNLIRFPRITKSIDPQVVYQNIGYHTRFKPNVSFRF